jgi:Fic family protein
VGWLAFVLDAVAVQARDVLGRAQALQQLRDDYRSRVAGVRSSSLLPCLVDALFDTPALTINAARRLLGLTHRAATVHITTLLDAGLLVEIPASGRVRRFVAREILAVTNGETAPLDNPGQPSTPG